MPQPDAIGIRFVLSATAEPLPEDVDPRPCAYCNSATRVAEREEMAYQEAAEKDIPEFRVPDNVGFVNADYVLRFGHEDGEGVEVPVCDMCLDGVPVEHDGETAASELTHEYAGDGKIAKPIVEEDEKTGQTVHRRETVNDPSE